MKKTLITFVMAVCYCTCSFAQDAIDSVLSKIFCREYSFKKGSVEGSFDRIKKPLKICPEKLADTNALLVTAVKKNIGLVRSMFSYDCDMPYFGYRSEVLVSADYGLGTPRILMQDGTSIFLGNLKSEVLAPGFKTEHRIFPFAVFNKKLELALSGLIACTIIMPEGGDLDLLDTIRIVPSEFKIEDLAAFFNSGKPAQFRRVLESEFCRTFTWKEDKKQKGVLQPAEPLDSLCPGDNLSDVIKSVEKHGFYPKSWNYRAHMKINSYDVKRYVTFLEDDIWLAPKLRYMESEFFFGWFPEFEGVKVKNGKSLVEIFDKAGNKVFSSYLPMSVRVAVDKAEGLKNVYFPKLIQLYHE